MSEAETSYAALTERSAALPYSFPTEANRLRRFAERAEEVEEHAAGTRPVLHARTFELMERFLELKREAGSPVEQALYAGLDARGLITRLLARRPLAFLNPSDSYLLRDGAQGHGGFEAIGTAEEQAPLTLAELIGYDEMELSALLGVSTPTHFINSGSRRNCAQPAEPGSFEARGVYLGLVGTRFERPGRMEWRHMMVTREHNTAARGYGAGADPDAPATRLLRLWAEHYGLTHFPSYEEAAADGSDRYWTTHRGYFDRLVYRRRLRASIETFLREGDARGREARRPAYLHAVGLGLGVWGVDPRQGAEMVDVYAEVLREVRLEHVADLDFSWFGDLRECGGTSSGEVFRAGGNEVRIHFSRRDPAALLQGEDAGKLLVAMYAWDSNAFPGNEYWFGALDASGDPAAACCSTIPELQNPDVNPRVAGEFARVLGAGAGD